MSADLGSVWRAPAASPPPPTRVWRDYALVAAVAVVVALEALLRPGVPSSMLVVVAAVAPTLLWRRTKPLAMVVVVMAATASVALVVGDAESPIASAFIIVILYALCRWGSGRSMMVGLGIVLVHLTVTEVVLTGAVILEDLVGGLVVIITVASLGLAVRFRASARSRELESARMLERERLARDVHDTVAHHVSAIAIRAQAGLATSTLDPAAVTDALRVIESEASRSLTELRSMLRVLRLDDAADLQFSPQVRDLEQLARSEQGGPVVDVRLTGRLDDVPPAVMTAVYRIAQESVTNARRHAVQATRIDVAVDADEEQVRVQVRDDGAGTNGTASTRGFGITGMVERAALLGGTCTAGRSSDSGWTVAAVLPRSGWAS
ncbi:histidine kinase [Georgenia sp. 10Sc9-8]|uniref:histidine kinase n=1 Tax=Georgenia halotolerans TaxID=3028317 RepID=A0ABT5U1K3_9MICO|nr:histidine kinase [Georgenia halotolerans]